jgi:hypothetical protein
MGLKYASQFEIDKGINKQLPARKVVWSDGRNVRFTPGYVSKTLGKTVLGTTTGAEPIREVFTFIGTDGVVRSIICCDSVVYAANSDFSSFSVITPTITPTGGASDIWQFELVGGLPILTNGKDAIWKWPVYGSILIPLVGAPTYAKRLSSCMNRLVVSNLSEGGYAYTGRIRWTEMGNPENWTIDLTGKSGRFDLMNYTSGVEAFENVKAQLSIDHKVYFFVDKNIWASDFSQAIRQFLIVAKDTELLSSRAACHRKGIIYYIGKDDIYRFTGGQPEPIGASIRDDLFDNINQSALSAVFSFSPHGTKEIWFCVPTGSSTVADTSFVYNYELDNWTIVDVDFSCHSESYLAGIPIDVVGNSAGKILQLDSGFNTPSGGTSVAITGTIETGDMDLKLPDTMKRISDILVELAAQDEVSELMIQVGLRNRIADEIEWSDPVPFTIGVSDFCDFCDFRREGKYVRLRFYSDQLNSPWKMIGYTVKYELGGTR